jgi:hypothetical protein
MAEWVKAETRTRNGTGGLILLDAAIRCKMVSARKCVLPVPRGVGGQEQEHSESSMSDEQRKKGDKEEEKAKKYTKEDEKKDIFCTTFGTQVKQLIFLSYRVKRRTRRPPHDLKTVRRDGLDDARL